MSARPTRGRNARTLLVLLGVLAGMGGLVAASVPLYRLFCQVTGYGGTTQTAEQAPERVLGRTMTVRFDATVDSALPWAFRPMQREVEVKVGEQGMAYFYARNDADRPIVGRAVFNVTPAKAGLFFNKVHCFCFDEQTLRPGEEAEMPVTFFVDPAIADDRNLDEVDTITLSYTFFRAADAEPETQRMSHDMEAGRPPVN